MRWILVGFVTLIWIESIGFMASLIPTNVRIPMGLFIERMLGNVTHEMLLWKHYSLFLKYFNNTKDNFPKRFNLLKQFK